MGRIILELGIGMLYIVSLSFTSGSFPVLGLVARRGDGWGWDSSVVSEEGWNTALFLRRGPGLLLFLRLLRLFGWITGWCDATYAR